MRSTFSTACIVILIAGLARPQQPTKSTNPAPPHNDSAASKLKSLLESNVTAEWEAFKNKDKKAYSDLLADDFIAVEDDGEGMRKKTAATAEVDRSVVSNYRLFAVTVVPLNTDSALVTYELTLEFPIRSAVRFKRVLVSEVWIKRNGQWKERYYQETKVK